MTKFVVYEVEYGGDVDGTGPERWHGTCVGVFDTEDEADNFVYSHHNECEVIKEEE